MNQPQIQNNKPDIVREMKVDIVNGFYKIWLYSTKHNYINVHANWRCHTIFWQTEWFWLNWTWQISRSNCLFELTTCFQFSHPFPVGRVKLKFKFLLQTCGTDELVFIRVHSETYFSTITTVKFNIHYVSMSRFVITYLQIISRLC